MKILICGLPGSGKTTLAKCLASRLNAVWFNADEVRAEHDDWDFSDEGRLRQAERMRKLADKVEGYVICDFVAPTEELRKVFDADYTIWVDTIAEGRFADTNQLFEPPSFYNMAVYTKDASHWADAIERSLNEIVPH